MNFKVLNWHEKKSLFSDLIIGSRNQKCQKVEIGCVTPLDHCALLHLEWLGCIIKCNLRNPSNITLLCNKVYRCICQLTIKIGSFIYSWFCFWGPQLHSFIWSKNNLAKKYEVYYCSQKSRNLNWKKNIFTSINWKRLYFKRIRAYLR